jgi:hypothetical protein
MRKQVGSAEVYERLRESHEPFRILKDLRP